MPAAIRAPLVLADIFFFSGIGSGSAFATGAADTCTGGGGQVILPAFTTVTERWTTSLKSITALPFFLGVSSFNKLTRLVP